ncbi:MAG: hypothetical protein ACLPMG_16885 [Terriglobales bacterium]
MTTLRDGTEKVGRIGFLNGAKKFDVTTLPNGTVKAGRVELPNRKRTFDVLTQVPVMKSRPVMLIPIGHYGIRNADTMKRFYDLTFVDEPSVYRRWGGTRVCHAVHSAMSPQVTSVILLNQSALI